LLSEEMQKLVRAYYHFLDNKYPPSAPKIVAMVILKRKPKEREKKKKSKYVWEGTSMTAGCKNGAKIPYFSKPNPTKVPRAAPIIMSSTVLPVPEEFRPTAIVFFPFQPYNFSLEPTVPNYDFV